jgi:hypothetical protein
MKVGIALLALAATAKAHSWLGCSDYRGSVNSYEEETCQAFPRPGHPTGTGYALGADIGYNYQPGNSCQSAFGQSYNSAVYEQGGTYCLAWPTNNHASATCTNANIPDTEMSLFRSDVNPTADPSQADFKKNKVDHHFGTHVQGTVDCLGYQRSPGFCGNTDRALATGCFTIPADQPLGKYVYQWYWIFNPGSPYLTCWDAEVVAKGAGNGYGGLKDADAVTGTDDIATACKTNWATLPGYPWKVGSAGAPNGAVDDPTPAPAGGPPAPTSPPVLSGDTFRVSNAPTTITLDPFELTLDYSSLGDRAFTVDLLSTAGNWFGKGTATVTGAGSASLKVTVTPQNTPAKGAGYKLVAWMVDVKIYNEWVKEMEDTSCGATNTCTKKPWTEEMMRFELPVAVGDAVVFPTAAPSRPMSSAGALSSSGLLVLFLALAAPLLQ